MRDKIRILGLICFIILHSLTQTQAQRLWGVSSYGGTGLGSIFSLNIDGSGYKEEFVFNLSFTGFQPVGALVQGTDSCFYGVCESGGLNHGGTIFRFCRDGNFEVLKHFESAFSLTNSGSNPSGGLTSGEDGFFYGMCEYGGSKQIGTIFKISQAGEFTKMRDLDTLHGGKPSGSLRLGKDGNLYGACKFYGTFPEDVFGDGTLFKMSKDGSFEVLHNFLGDPSPQSNINFDSEGNIYGIYPTPPTLFKYNTNNDYEEVIAFRNDIETPIISDTKLSSRLSFISNFERVSDTSFVSIANISAFNSVTGFNTEGIMVSYFDRNLNITYSNKPFFNGSSLIPTGFIKYNDSLFVGTAFSSGGPDNHSIIFTFKISSGEINKLFDLPINDIQSSDQAYLTTGERTNILSGINVSTNPENSISIHPNPNNGNFTIDSEYPMKENILIYDLHGNTIVDIENNELKQVKVSGLRSGFYFVNIGRFKSKILVE